MKKKEILVVVGPTASGKTSLGIALAHQHKGAVISADSRQVYAMMNIGTAKPQEAWNDNIHDISTPNIVERVPHYLLNISSPDNPLSLPEWQQDANAVIEKTLGENLQPIIVGGTMLYIDSVVKNFSIPTVTPNPELRENLEKQSAEELFATLIAQDPDAGTFIEPHHKQRIIRALEVMQKTGKPFSSQRTATASPYSFRMIGIFPGWDMLEKNIRARTLSMFDNGLIEETQKIQKTFSPDLPLLKTMNYLQAAKVINGTYSKDEAAQEAIRATLRYARRQMSWWKNRKEIEWIKDS